MNIYKTAVKIIAFALVCGALVHGDAPSFGYTPYDADNPSMQLAIGREYYQEHLNKAMQRHWAFPATLSLTIGDQGYGCDGTIVSLAETVFGSDRFTFGDIFLLAKLSGENKVTIPGDPLTTDVLTTLLAPIKLEFDAETRELAALFTASYRRSLGDTERMDVVVGLNVPIKTQFHILNINFDSGSLLNPMGTNLPVAQSTLAQFFSFYEDIYDFFVASILKPKGLTYLPLQRKTGLGDITFFGYLDGAQYFNYVDALQVGVTWTVPTTTADVASTLWAPDISEGGGSSVGFFSNALIHSPWAGINPAVQVSVDVSPTFYGTRRIAQLKQFNGPVDGVHNVIGKNPLGGLIQSVPPVFNDLVTTFSEYDSTVPAFADAAVRARIKRAPRILAGIGNYFYNFLKKDFVLGIFYDYTHKAKDCFKVCSDAVFDTKSLAKLTEVNSHRISWRLSYRFQNYIELNGGTQHIVGGNNVIQLNQLYVSLIAVF